MCSIGGLKIQYSMRVNIYIQREGENKSRFEYKKDAEKKERGKNVITHLKGALSFHSILLFHSSPKIGLSSISNSCRCKVRFLSISEKGTRR